MPANICHGYGEHMTYDEIFAMGRSFDQFLEGTVANGELWHALARRAVHNAPADHPIAAVSGQWRLLVIADDWCGDAVNVLPVVARLASSANIELRIVGRDEHTGLMDRHLTKGSRSIPVVILLDREGRPRGWWGPRPRPLQDWFDRAGRPLPKEERYRELRRWYARDRGDTIASEIAALIRCGASAAQNSYRGTEPCAELAA